MKPILLTFLISLLALPMTYARDHEDEFEGEHEEEPIRLNSKQVAGFLKKHFPKQYEEMRVLKEEEPEEFEELFDEAHDLATEYMEIREENPEMAEHFLEVEKTYHAIWVMVGEAHEHGKTAEDLEEIVRGKLEHVFELRIELERSELERLEEEVEDFRHEIEDHEEHREEIINEELEEILEDFEEEDDEDEDEEEEDDGF